MLEGDLGTDKSNQTGSNNAAQYAQNDHRSDTLCQQIGYQNLGSETYYATLAGAALAVVKAIRLSSFPFNCGGICPHFLMLVGKVGYLYLLLNEGLDLVAKHATSQDASRTT